MKYLKRSLIPEIIIINIGPLSAITIDLNWRGRSTRNPLFFCKSQQWSLSITGVMGDRVGLLLLVLVISWACADATKLEISDVTVTKLNYEVARSESKIFEEKLRKERLCNLCEEFTAQAVDYLVEKKTQTEIITVLHQACSQLHSIKEQCVMLVDYYAPLFLVEIALIRPEELCEKVNLCGEMTTFVPRIMSDDTCTLCHQTIVDFLTKLKDPETQLKVIEILLKACNEVKPLVQECKKLVFEYGPIILINAEKLLETTDICAVIHVCKANKEKSVLQAFLTELPIYDA